MPKPTNRKPSAKKKSGKPAPGRIAPPAQSLKTAEENARDRRKSARLGLSAVTRYLSDGEEYVGVTRLINLGGLLMEVGEPLALGSRVSLELNLPNSIRSFRAQGEVVYRNLIRGRLAHAAGEMGIRFLALEAEAEAMLRDLTERYLEFSAKHSVFSKEMTTFQDPTIIPTHRDPSDELA